MYFFHLNSKFSLHSQRGAASFVALGLVKIFQNNSVTFSDAVLHKKQDNCDHPGIKFQKTEAG